MLLKQDVYNTIALKSDNESTANSGQYRPGTRRVCVFMFDLLWQMVGHPLHSDRWNALN